MDAESVVAIATTVVFAVLALLAIRIHLHQRTSSSHWMLLSFVTIGAAVILGAAGGGNTGLARSAGVVSAMLLLGFPYALFRFSASFESPPAWIRRVVDAATVLVIAALPLIPLDESAPEALVTVYIAIVALYWTSLSLGFVVRLWRSSLGQPSVIRQRLRVLAGAAAILNLALLIAVTRPGEGGLPLLIQTLAMASAVMFLVGFAPPGPLRRSWRHADEMALRQAERGLIAAEDVTTVAQELIPQIGEVFGGDAALVDVTGRSLGGPSAITTMGSLPRAAPGEVEIIPGSLILGLENGLIVVSATAYTPFFGQEDVALLQAFAASVDLALSRVALLERERSARADAEAVNAELEALLYGISHDLRTPLVALTGYVELLAEEGPDTTDGQFVLGRMKANTSYMDALITDLLDLSRIGRTLESSAAVDLRGLAADLAAEVAFTHPTAQLDIGELPVVEMEPTRARQLLTNLVGNALRHSGRQDVTITLTAARDARGATVSVADDGVGIGPEHRQQVFGIFERLQARDGHGGGTGIGLAMCRKIVEQLGGSVWIGDAAVGTDVRFRIPVDKLRAAEAGRSA